MCSGKIDVMFDRDIQFMYVTMLLTMPLYRLIVLGLKHFEGTVQSDQLISSYLLCKNRWNFRKHVREMSSQRAPPNIIKVKSLLHQRSHID